MSGPKANAASLTGVWQGLYSYASAADMVPFTATLIETGAHFSGSTHETCPVEGKSRATLFALVDGARAGHAVSFVKTYDGSAGWEHSVAYEGAMNGEGTEIEGTWRVRGGITGRFLMTRPSAKAKSTEVREMMKV